MEERVIIFKAQTQVDAGSLSEFRKIADASTDVRVALEKTKQEAAALRKQLRNPDLPEEEFRRLTAELVKTEQAAKDLKNEQKLLDKEFQRLKTPINSMERFRKEINKLQAQLNRHQKGVSITAEEYDKLAKRVADGRAEIIKFDKGLNDGRINIGRYTESLQDLLPAFDGLGGLGNIGSSLASSFQGGLGKAGVAGAVITAGVVIGTEVNKIVQEFKFLRDQVEDQTGETSRAIVDNITTGAKAIADTFKQPFEDIVQAANTLNAQLGLSFDESFQFITDGFVNGADASGEFISSIREYSTQIEAAGASADEFLEILVLSEQEGIFSDKGVDTVKEFGLRVREQTTASREALENAFGRTFADQIFGGISDGSLTTIEAMRKVSAQINNTTIPTEKLQTLIADLYGGAGEDAGLNFIRSLENLDGQLDSTSNKTSAYTSEQLALLQANKDLAEQSNLLSRQLEGIGINTSAIGSQIKTVLLEALNATILQARVFGRNLSEIFRSISQGSFDFEFVDKFTLIAEDAAKAQDDQLIKTQQLAAESKKAEVQAVAEAQAKRDVAAQNARIAEAERLANLGVEGSVARLKDEINKLQGEFAKVADPTLMVSITQQIDATEERLQKLIGQAAIAARQESGVTVAAPNRLDTIGNTVGVFSQTEDDDLTIDSETGAITSNENISDDDFFADIELKNLQAANKKKQDLLDEALEEERQREEERQSIYSDAATSIGETFGSFLSDQEVTFRDFQRAILNTALDALERTIQLAAVEATAKLIASNPLLGAIAAAGIQGVIRGLFAGVRNIVDTFHDGGIIGDGGFASSDTALRPDEQYIKAQKGEAVVNVRSMRDKKIRTVTGTNAQIVSQVNELGGGNAFALGASLSDLTRVPVEIQNFQTPRLQVRQAPQQFDPQTQNRMVELLETNNRLFKENNELTKRNNELTAKGRSLNIDELDLTNRRKLRDQQISIA